MLCFAARFTKQDRSVHGRSFGFAANTVACCRHGGPRGLEARRTEKIAAAFAHRRRPPRLLRTVDVRSILPACHHRTAAAGFSRIRWAFTEPSRRRVKFHRQEHQRRSRVSTCGMPPRVSAITTRRTPHVVCQAITPVFVRGSGARVGNGCRKPGMRQRNWNRLRRFRVSRAPGSKVSTSYGSQRSSFYA